MLEISKVSVALSKKTVLKNISVDIRAPELIAVIGANGVGKSSLLRAISGELKTASGEIRFLNQPIDRWDEKKLAQNMAVLPQSSALRFPFLVEDVIMLGRLPHSTGKAKNACLTNKVMEKMDVSQFVGTAYTELSGGEKQRVQLARVLSQIISEESNPNCGRLLLLDEPTTALDIAHQHALFSYLQDVKQQGVAIVTVIHDLNLAARYADTIWALTNGTIQACGSPREVFTSEHLKVMFNVEACIVQHPTESYPIVTL